MTRNLRSLLLSAALLAVASGCALTKSTRPLPEGDCTSPIRSATLVREFETRRDRAQLGAALDRWKQGDSPGSETLLLQLIERQPQNREARFALADLYAAKGDSAAAFAQLLDLLEQSPDDAQAHHSLGLLLETLERPDEALRHFDRAVAIEPRNELYALSRDACRDGE